MEVCVAAELLDISFFLLSGDQSAANSRENEHGENVFGSPLKSFIGVAYTKPLKLAKQHCH